MNHLGLVLWTVWNEFDAKYLILSSLRLRYLHWVFFFLQPSLGRWLINEPAALKAALDELMRQADFDTLIMAHGCVVLKVRHAGTLMWMNV